jgi:hypothetical protein
LPFTQISLTAPQVLFRALAFGDIALAYRQLVVSTWVDSILDPLSQQRRIKLVGDLRAFARCTTQHFLARKMWILLPRNFSDETRGMLA